MSEQNLKPAWKILKFGDFVECVREQGQPTEEDSRNYIGLEHLDSGSLHVKRWGSDADLKGQKLRMKKGDLLFAKRNAYLRRVAIAPHDGFFSAHGMVLRPTGKHILPDFLPFFLQSDMFMERAIEISVGSLSPTINWKALKVQEFPLPPLDEQKRIAEILWTADDAVQKYKESLNALAALKSQTLRASLRHESTREVACSKLYSTPPRNGFSPKTNASEAGCPTLSIGAVRDGKVDPNGNTKYAEISPSDLEKFRLASGDILVVRGNGNKTLCGKAGLVSELPENCFYPDLLIRIAFDEKQILPAFAVEQWNDPLTHGKLLAFAKSTNGIWKVNGKDLRQHKLLVPGLHVQREIVDKLSTISAGEEQLTKHVEVLLGLQRQIANDVTKGATHV
ncbi:MAG: restriction endonuclease subunit S [Candidatus Thiodiazotropha sp.]